METGLRSTGALMESISCCSPAGSGRAASDSGEHWPVLLANAGDFLLRGFVAGIDFGGMKELGQCALLVAGLEELSPLGEVHGGGGLPDAIEGGAVAQVLGIFGVGLLEEVEGGVVILAGLGVLAALVEGIGGLGVKAQRRQGRGSQDGRERNADEGFARRTDPGATGD